MNDEHAPGDQGPAPEQPLIPGPEAVRMPNRPTSPGGLNSVGMNSATGLARGGHPHEPGKKAEKAMEAAGWGALLCEFLPWTLVRLSTLLVVAAALAPRTVGRGPVLAALGFYRRRLTRFTRTCPSTPSCSAYAVAAVAELGPRRGLAAAARRVRHCGRPTG